MKRIILFPVLLLCIAPVVAQQSMKSFCNPINLNYRFQPSKTAAYREAADPVITIYAGKYFLYASHSGGYWYSDDLLNWNYVKIKSLPIEDYAPDVVTINDTTYYIASSGSKNYIYFTTNPFEDNWTKIEKPLPFPVWDPSFFRDENGRLYLYWGCSDNEANPIKGVELTNGFQPSGTPVTLIRHNPALYGWEKPGEENQVEKNGYNEGAWMTKYKDRYYLQYASPGTEFRTYADGVYTSSSPLGPFTYEKNSPFSYKPGGFIGGAGHSSTFMDKYGNYWHISSMSISVRHMFERRLGLFPAAFDKDGVLRTFTAFGDYPTILPDHKIDLEKETLFRGWMLQSYKKNVRASSSLSNFQPVNAVDENIRTWWSASTGNKGEWLSVELDDNTDVNAIQVNFADNDAMLQPGSENLQYCYRLLASEDGKSWTVVADKSNNTSDACHDYVGLEKAVSAKYIKVENIRVPDGKFSIYDLRIFGTRKGKIPGKTKEFNVIRTGSDPRRAKLSWAKDNTATGYVVWYGTESDKLYTPVMVYGTESLALTGLNRDVKYYFRIDAFNESGIRRGTEILKH
jgi:xylan 1,4-beta-xylosidase